MRHKRCVKCVWGDPQKTRNKTALLNKRKKKIHQFPSDHVDNNKKLLMTINKL